MKIHGLIKTSLLDYPKHVAATVFTGACNMRCPFCHNGNLVLNPEGEPLISEEEVLSFLSSRARILDGVCITGGEPTLQGDLASFIGKIKAMGLKVKLDTNGYNPDILNSLLEQGLIDYVAMDIKNSKAKYPETTDIKDLDFSRIEASIKTLVEGKIPFEFRTTVARELHSKEDLLSIAAMIKGCPAYYLQAYRESDQVINPVFTSYSREEFDDILSSLREILPVVELRGLD